MWQTLLWLCRVSRKGVIVLRMYWVRLLTWFFFPKVSYRNMLMCINQFLQSSSWFACFFYLLLLKRFLAKRGVSQWLFNWPEVVGRQCSMFTSPTQFFLSRPLSLLCYFAFSTATGGLSTIAGHLLLMITRQNYYRDSLWQRYMTSTMAEVVPPHEAAFEVRTI